MLSNLSLGRKLVYAALSVLSVAAVYTTVHGGGGEAADGGESSATTASAPSTAPARVTVPPPIPRGVTSRNFPKALPGELSRASAAPDGRGGFYVVGGLDYLKRPTPLITHIDPVTMRATTAGGLAVPVASSGSAFLDGRVIVVGGGVDPGAGVKTTQSFAGSGSSRVLGAMTTGRYGFGTAVVDGRLLIVGGGDSNGDARDVLATADGVTFETIATLDAGVRYAAVAAIGETVYVIGGEVGGRMVASVYAIDVANGEVSKVNTELDIATSHAAAFEIDGAIFVVGGRTERGLSNRIWRFDPSIPTFLIGGALPSGRADSAAVVVDGKAFVIGGESGSFLQAIVELTPTQSDAELIDELSKDNSIVVPSVIRPTAATANRPTTTTTTTRPPTTRAATTTTTTTTTAPVATTGPPTSSG